MIIFFGLWGMFLFEIFFCLVMVLLLFCLISLIYVWILIWEFVVDNVYNEKVGIIFESWVREGE